MKFKMPDFTQMLKDDITKEWSEGRVLCLLCFLWTIHCSNYALMHPELKLSYDIQTNWLAALVLFYGMNKGSSTIQAIQGAKNVGKSDTQSVVDE